MKYGYPTTDNLFQYEGHILAYSNFFKCPLWVCERITKVNLGNKRVDRKTHTNRNSFVEVDELEDFSSDNSDFSESGFDRGHMAAAGNHQHSPRAYSDTFKLTNVCPQSPDLNRRLWNELEGHIRGVVWDYDVVHALTGPLFAAVNEKKANLVVRRIGQNRVSVPTHFFKVYCWSQSGGMRLDAYIMPNRCGLKGSLSNYIVHFSEVERKAGFRVFSLLTRKTSS